MQTFRRSLSSCLLGIAVGFLGIEAAFAAASYEYDALGRLTTVLYDDNDDQTIDRRIDYTYDAAGNRTQMINADDGTAPANAAPVAVDDGASGTGNGLPIAFNAAATTLDVLANVERPRITWARETKGVDWYHAG